MSNKTIVAPNAFDKKANLRSSEVREFRDGIEEVLEAANEKLEDISIKDGTPLLVVASEKAAELVSAEIRRMGIEPEVAGRKIDLFVARYLQQKKRSVA